MMSQHMVLQNYKEKSLLVVKTNGQLIRIYCPFPVKNQEGVFLTVTAIIHQNKGFPYFAIDGTYYIYSLFVILAY